jgi:hypothetical protein
MTIGPRAAQSADILERTRLLAFVAQTFAVRAPHEHDRDELEDTISSVRDAVDEITALLPTPDEAANYEFRQGCALLTEAVDLIEDVEGERMSRLLRRRVAVLNAQAAKHIAAALDRLGTVRYLRTGGGRA